jgi:hydrogenase maturation protease
VKRKTVLLIGYGNPGRLDDGLGPAAAEAVAGLRLTAVTVDVDYQLNVEDAQSIAQHDVVVFADAADRGPCLSFRKLTATEDGSFTTHSVSPAQAMGLARRLFGARTQAYVLAIRGYEFNEYEERLSERALSNLAEAVRFLRKALPSLAAGRKTGLAIRGARSVDSGRKRQERKP